MERLQTRLARLKRLYDPDYFGLKIIGEDKDVDSEIFTDELKKKVASELDFFSHRLTFRRKYGLSPLDSRYLEMTDEDILFDLMLNNEYDVRRQERSRKAEEAKLIETDPNTDKFLEDPSTTDMLSRIEAGEDVDLEKLMHKPEEWEEV